MKAALTRITGFLLALAIGVSAVGADSEQRPLRLPDIGDPAGRTLTVGQEKRLGDSLIREVRQRIPISDDAELRHYIQDLGNRLLASADNPGFDFEFFVVDSPTVNAFAMPGGYIGMNSGLIMRTQSESELAAVMAHEIAHVTQRHIARTLDATRGSGLRTLGIIMAAILLGMQDPDAGSAAAMAGIAGSIQEQIDYTRAHEREADNIGIQILADAGLDPHGMPRFFERLEQATRFLDRPPEYLSTHPVTENRISDSRARAQAYGDRESQESPMYAFMRARLIANKADTAGSAERHFRAALDNAGSDEERAYAEYGLALAMIRHERFDRANELLEQTLETLGEHVPLYSAMAVAAREDGRLSESIDLYELGLSLFPNNYPLTVGLAEALLEDNRAGEARELVRRKLQRDGPDPHLYRLHGQAAAEAGRPHEGRLAMAEHYQMYGRLQLAVEQLNQVIDAADADINTRSRAIARRQELVRLFEEQSEFR